MNVLLIGSGGREHALAWELTASPLLDRLYCAPGNAGIAEVAECVALDVADHAAVVGFCQDNGHRLRGGRARGAAGRRARRRPRAAGIKVFGPSAAAAQLEGSKGFTKDLCRRDGIPTAAYAPLHRRAAARQGLCRDAERADRRQGRRAGRRQGRGHRRRRARRPNAAIDDCFGGAFGAAGAEVVIEEFLDGEEASFFALVDGEHAPAARHRAGPQARRRRRHRPQHRRHGRLFARRRS